MSISNSTASSRRSSEASIVLPNPKYKRIFESNANYSPLERIKANDVFKQELFSKLLKSINGTKWQNGSYFLTVGKQHKDGRFQEVFIDFFRLLRGGNPLVNSAGEVLASRFETSPDMCSIINQGSVS